MNYARFYLLLKCFSAADKEELKESLVSQYTGGRTTSLKEMTTDEYDALCRALEQSEENRRAREAHIELMRQKRSVVLYLMLRLGIDTSDWARVDAYCMDPRIAGKKFRKLTEEELDTVAIKLRLIKRKETAKQNSKRFIN